MLIIGSIVLSTIFLLSPPHRVYAENFAVDDVSDSPDASLGDGTCATATGKCTLRAAIEEANANEEADTITLPANTYTLSLGQLTISEKVTITGAGAGSSIIDGNNASRIFLVDAEGVGTISLQSVTLTRGKVSNTSDGGAIYNNRSLLELKNIELKNNTAGYGGAIFNNTGTVTMESAKLSNNKASTEGGAIHHFNETSANPKPRMTLTNVVVENNESFSAGGGIYVNPVTDFILRNSTISGNKITSADGVGGGLFINGTATIENSFIVSNETKTSGCSDTGGCSGGGIAIDTTGELILTGSTVEYNTAYNHGGGLFRFVLLYPIFVWVIVLLP